MADEVTLDERAKQMLVAHTELLVRLVSEVAKGDVPAERAVDHIWKGHSATLDLFGQVTRRLQDAEAERDRLRDRLARIN